MSRHKALVSYVFFVNCVTSLKGDAKWSYTNPRNSPVKWGETYPICAGHYQAPIDLVESSTTYDSNLGAMRMFKKPGVDLSTAEFTVMNNGHTVTVMFPDQTFLVSYDDDFGEKYVVASMYFHWGENSKVGSEHFINSEQTSLETHIVCYNNRFYKDVTEAAGKPSGLAVLAFLQDVDAEAEDGDTQMGLFTGLEEAIGKVTESGMETTVEALNLTKVMTQVNPEAYFRYLGSLTTPPCTNNVVWTVFRAIIPVLPTQLTRLLTLKFPKSEIEPKMCNNFRPLQDINPKQELVKRVIYRSWNGANGVISLSWMLTGTVVFHMLVAI